MAVRNKQDLFRKDFNDLVQDGYPSTQDSEKCRGEKFLYYNWDLNNEVFRVCFFLLSSATKQGSCDVITRAVTIWGQESSREGVSECATCDRKRGVAKGEKRHRP